ncbi:hypothetical protein [Empedobacter falsenii]|uniref:hypothetical protein n=1 Tax=Empedobacter falsenii TaxID=343874 RepID=UPI001C8EB782|nr:hypothetical protein [Empedobacter falsenii]MBY0066823.1 hypothetical protein [Empedobacter falsenii]
MTQSNNSTSDVHQQKIKNQALILEQEILGTVLNIIRKTENPTHIANVIKDMQQDFIGYFDSCDYDYLRDGNIIFTEFQSIFNSLAVAEPEAIEKLQEKNKQRYDRISIKMKL